MKRRTWQLWCSVGAVLASSCALVLWWKPAKVAKALPSAPSAFCQEYDNSPLCRDGNVTCTTCHTIPPSMNVFGAQIRDKLLAGKKGPLPHDQFLKNLPQALRAVASLDADGDGVTNGEEIKKGSLPGDPNSKPDADACKTAKGGWNVCGKDLNYTYKKVYLDFCGRSPNYTEWAKFQKLGDGEKDTAIDALLKRCVDSEYWMGKDGVVWRLAHAKIRPLQAVKSGEGEGAIPLGDYYDDYNLFVYTQIDNHDARAVLTADFFVERSKTAPTVYKIREGRGSGGGGISSSRQNINKDKRAGLLTTRWNLVFQTMFSVLPRATAAQAYRAFLGYDLAKMEGLFPVRNEPADYDKKGVRQAECARCHSTLDPLSYPFSRYNGLSVNVGGVASYVDQRMVRLARSEGPRLAYVPEAGLLFGKKVANLVEWSKVAANSDHFAKATVMDYWKLLMGHKPKQPKAQIEYNQLWKDFRTTHNYSVEKMLLALIKTEAYRVP